MQMELAKMSVWLLESATGPQTTVRAPFEWAKTITGETFIITLAQRMPKNLKSKVSAEELRWQSAKKED
tara:strand:- start:28616 stop:28822 length:207 start_codon:yes stop_codon:yes gene_type:complete